MSNPIIVSVEGHGHIQYLEYSNRWAAVREGAHVAERASLAEARQALIDLVKRESAKGSPFKRHKAYSAEYRYSLPEPVTVTSYASDSEAWVTNEQGRRSKVRLDDLREFNGLNKAVFEQITKLKSEEQALAKERQRLQESLQAYKKVAS